ncbi:uncharacterized protein LOC141707679 isoform X2 [Apium graveolens]|uniref:uncharacterized protein LOC141707679 isoform X2 n=1 Tax=Apium graveolens TaxID=4045 RepID=UPI003D79ECBE
MEDEWEDGPVPPVEKEKDWEEEDKDENDIKESWEDDDDEPVVEPVAEPSASAKKTAKPSEKKGKAVEIVKNEPLDPVAEKLRQQRLVEEADFRNTAELFELISHKLRPYEKSYHYIGLLKAVMRLSMTSLKAADAKEVSSSVTAISNEKIKAEKEANAGKKKSGPKKKQLLIDKPDDDAVINKYDTTYDEYDDFM